MVKRGKMSSENNTKMAKQLKRKDKQFLIITDKTREWFYNLKSQLRENGVTLTYNKIVEKMIKSIDKDKFEAELKTNDLKGKLKL